MKKKNKILLFTKMIGLFLMLLMITDKVYATHGNEDTNRAYRLRIFQCDPKSEDQRKEIVADNGGLSKFTKDRVGVDRVWADGAWRNIKSKYLYEDCLFAFGDPDDIEGNYWRNGIPLFLGYDYKGQPLPNAAYPEWFARSTFLTYADYNFYKNPWNKPWNSSNASQSDKDKVNLVVGGKPNTTDANRLKRLSQAIDKYQDGADNGRFQSTHPDIGKPWIDGTDASTLSQYADVHTLGDNWTPGLFTLYFAHGAGHSQTQLGYSTFYIPPVKNPFDGNARVTAWMPVGTMYHEEATYFRTDIFNEMFGKKLKTPCTTSGSTYVNCKSSEDWTQPWTWRIKKGFNKDYAWDSDVVDNGTLDGYVVSDGSSETARPGFSLPAGKYTLWVKIPYYQRESDYDDNYVSWNFTIKPKDLELRNYFVINPTDPRKSDEGIDSMKIQVRNNTDKELGPFDIQYYWETEPGVKMCERIDSIAADTTITVTLGAGDNALCSGEIASPKTDYPRYEDLAKQNDVGLVVEVNHNKLVNESDYSNNERTFDIDVDGLNASIYSSIFSYYAIDEESTQVKVTTKISNKMRKYIDSTCIAPYPAFGGWTVKEYNKKMSNDRIPPKFSDISGLSPVKTYSADDVENLTVPSGVDYKMYHLSTQVYMVDDETVKLPITYIDDSFSVYVNGKFVDGGTYLNTYNFDLDLKKGNNKIEILYYEHTSTGKFELGNSIKDITENHEVCKGSTNKTLTYTLYNSNWTRSTGDDSYIKSWTKNYSDIAENKVSLPITSTVNLPPGEYRIVTTMPYYKYEYDYNDNTMTQYFEVEQPKTPYTECNASTPGYIQEVVGKFCIGVYPLFPSTNVEKGQGSFFYAKYRFFPVPMPPYEVDDYLDVNKFVFEGQDDWNEWTHTTSNYYWRNMSIYEDKVLGSVFKGVNNYGIAYYFDYTKDKTGAYLYDFKKGETYKFSIWLKADKNINNAGMNVYTTKTNSASYPVDYLATQKVNLSTKWQRYDFELTSSETGSFGVGYILRDFVAGNTVYAAKPSLAEVDTDEDNPFGIKQQFDLTEPLNELGNEDTFLYYKDEDNRGRLFPETITFDFQVKNPNNKVIPETIGQVYYEVPDTCIQTYTLDFKDERTCREVTFYIPSDEEEVINKTDLPDLENRMNYKNPGMHSFELRVTEDQRYHYQTNNGTATNPSWSALKTANVNQKSSDWRYNFKSPTTNFLPPASEYGLSKWDVFNGVYSYKYDFNVSGLSSGNGRN